MGPEIPMASHGPSGTRPSARAAERDTAKQNGGGVKNQLPRPGPDPALTSSEAGSAADRTSRAGSDGPGERIERKPAPLAWNPVPRDGNAELRAPSRRGAVRRPRPSTQPVSGRLTSSPASRSSLADQRLLSSRIVRRN